MDRGGGSKLDGPGCGRRYCQDCNSTSLASACGTRWIEAGLGRTWVCAVVRGVLASSIFVKKDPSFLARWGVENRPPRANGFSRGTLLCCDSLGHPSSLFFLGRILFSFSCTSRCWIDLHPSIRWERGRSSGSIGDGYSDDPGSRTRWVFL
eukprot:scaffold545_cov372-Pavlova_lutheri.AAC.16